MNNKKKSQGKIKYLHSSNDVNVSTKDMRGQYVALKSDENKSIDKSNRDYI